ncbi:DUF371 domain-containing protein [Actinokineospora iranica]|uniref:DUF371 domain-containing protein n=1 Tax=Actinokineospora iranica TaxID=1271860 RepID=A0A1G6VDX5_9PSEU|nr:DUF371 domain-containing protein [Actinokineospora iranica]SDD51217.1 hypothetical protein SAMN05216174_11258 [Actinokineospora iranica]
MADELLRLRCRGHRQIRATHAKTLEFAVDTDITGRATCVVGVDSALVGDPPAALAGPVLITVSAGGETATVRALANSRWRPGGAAVVRRSGERLPNTLATDADLAAADLPRALAAAMADPAAVVDVVVERDDRPDPRLVRYRAGQGHDDRLAAECAAAAAVLAEDPAARSVVTAHGGIVGAKVPSDSARVLAVSTTDTTGPAVRALLADRPVVEVLGLPPELAVAKASPLGGPVLLATGFARRDVVRLATAHRSSTVVFRCPASDLARHLDEAERAVGTRAATVLPHAGEIPVWGPLALAREVGGSGDVLCALDPVEDFPGDPAPDLTPAALLTALLAQDVSAKTLARALADQPGWSRKQAYDFVLGLDRPRKL